MQLLPTVQKDLVFRGPLDPSLEDNLVCNLNSNGVFHASSNWSFHRHHSGFIDWANKIWKSWIPVKISGFTLKLL